MTTRMQTAAASSLSPSERRGDTRFRPQGLDCPVGELLDLSISGMRLRCGGATPLAPNAVERFCLIDGDDRVHVDGRVVWARRLGLLRRRWDVGIQFVEVDETQRAILARLARICRVPPEPLPRVAAPPSGHGGPRASARPRDEPAAVPSEVAIEVGDLYGLLGIPRGATREQIRVRFRELARIHHPDISDAADAERTFALFAKAYRILSDDTLRRRYDERLARGGAA